MTPMPLKVCPTYIKPGLKICWLLARRPSHKRLLGSFAYTPRDALQRDPKKLTAERKARLLGEFVARSEKELAAGKWEKAIEA